MNGAPSHLDRPDSKSEFLARLRAVCVRKSPPFLSVALRVPQWTLLAETDSTGSPRAIDASQAVPVTAGCLTKPITASLVAEFVAKGDLDWDAEVSEILGVRGARQKKLSGIRLSHLLDHTHGLDSLQADVVPRTRRGFVDVTRLCSGLLPRSLSEPGELYSYGNSGAWLAGAALERISGRRYSQILAESSLLQPDCNSASLPMCPASGDGLQLTTAQWLTFLELHLHSGAATPEHDRRPNLVGLAPLLVPRVAMPGWSPAEQAACMGWKYYGGGWYGHNANMATCSALLRFNPRQGVALAMAGANDVTFFALAGLFGTSLPELVNMRIPRLLASEAAEVFRSDPYVGSFSRGGTRIVVAPAPRGRLSFTFRPADSHGTPACGHLRPAENQVFFPDIRTVQELPFVQFVPSKHSPGFDYLWNGKQLWRRD